MIEVPCAPQGIARWIQRTAMDGRDYELTFDWAQRMGHWTLSLADQDGAPIVSGCVLRSGWPLLRGVRDARRPAGELLVVDQQGKGEDPGFSELGERFSLVYLSQGEF